MAEAVLGVSQPMGGLALDLPEARSSSDTGASASGAFDPVVGLAARVERNLSHDSLHTSSELSLPAEVAGQANGLSQAHRATGSFNSLHGLDPTHDQTLDAPPRLNSNSREAAGRAPGVPLAPARHGSSDDIFATALGGLEINERPQGAAGLGRGLPHSASHGSGLHAEDGVDCEVQPRSLIIQNLVDSVSDEDLQQDLESYGDVQTLYTGTKAQGKVMVTFYDSMAASRAYAALSGRIVNGRTLAVHFHASQKDVQAGRVFLFNVDESLPDGEVRARMEAYGRVMLARRHPAVPFCREVYYFDLRAAQRAYNAIYPGATGVPTISENSSDISQQPISMGMRTAQSSHALASHAAVPPEERDWGRPRSWDNSLQPADLARMVSQAGGQQDLSGADSLGMLHPGAADPVDPAGRGRFATRSASSNSLPGIGMAGGPSAGSLRPLDSHPGSAANLAGLGGLTGSASHPDLTYMGPDGQATGAPPHAMPPPLPPAPTPPNSFTPSQMAALQNSGLLGGLGPASIANSRRGMSSPDLASLAQGGYALPAQGGQRWVGGGGGGQYSPNELSGWGANLAPGAPQGGAQLDATAQLLAQGGLNLGSLGALQRSVSALQLQQLQQQQQQQQLLLQLAGVNPQALAQLTNNMRLSSMPSSSSSGSLTRGKSHRSDDNLAGGRLSRRAADPAAEAERKAQQERHFALDEGKVERGEDVRTTLMIKNIPNKYTQKMLLQTIDEQFARLYDFFYLPIDFKNKCNVGYAFINMVRPAYILPFTKRFNQRKWERFNSEKVCHISYARIQGKAQLITHFQNSSLLHEDKRCRPILFKSDGELASDQEPFPAASGHGRGHRPRAFAPQQQPPDAA